MKSQNLIAQVAAAAGVGKLLVILLVLSSLGNVLGALGYVLSDKSIRQTLVPPSISKTFWVEDQAVSKEYLELMGEFVISLFANATPGSIDHNNSVILKWVHPSSYGPLEVKFRTAAAKLKAEGLSRYFAPREIQVQISTKSVVMIGTSEGFVSDHKLPPELKAYLVRFDYLGGRTSIVELRETAVEKPFDPPKPSTSGS